MNPISVGSGPENLFLLKSRSLNRVKRESCEGRFPVKLFLVKDRTPSLDIWPSSDGILPSNAFSALENTSRFSKIPISVGIEPVRNSSSIFRDVNLCSSPISDGMVPVNSLLERVNSCISTNKPISDGIEPWSKFFSPMSRLLSLFMRPSSVGIVPDKRLFERLIDLAFLNPTFVELESPVEESSVKGIDPVSLFPCNSNFSSLVFNPSSGTIFPEIEFSCKES
mmetsp:Transcript_6917/g.9764  ORF Transcript_6917/g.9764 Transcript_6917/m.9764 type:complete len:224 (-) Transcript_6917:1314-1985(-)